MVEQYQRTIDLNLSGLGSAGFLSRKLYNERNQGWESFYVSDASEQGIFPNTCVPIAGVIDYFKRKGFDITCSWEGDTDSYANKVGIHSPLSIRENLILGQITNPLDVVWRYEDSEEVNAFVDSVRNQLMMRASVEQGVAIGIEWCINEIMDNVLQHSNAACGYVMASYALQSKRFSICIFDNGVGIFNSLRGTKHNPSTPLDAITKALQERVTRDDRIGQGNGMWGLTGIVRDNGGSFTVISNKAKYSFFDGEVSTDSQTNDVAYTSEGLGTTLVDFQLDCSREIDLAKALNGYVPTALWLEELEGPTEEDHIISIAERSGGTGTRKAAEPIRNYAMNILRAGQKRVVLDFSGVNLISSSYADELIGKLVVEVGFSVFNSYFSISNVSLLNQKVIDRSVQQRMAQQYYSAPEIED